MRCVVPLIRLPRTDFEESDIITQSSSMFQHCADECLVDHFEGRKTYMMIL